MKGSSTGDSESTDSLAPWLTAPQKALARRPTSRGYARADYGIAPHNLNLLPGGNVAKPAYNQGATNEIQRKQGQGRMNVEFVGGTIVFGVTNGGAWELYWSTYGSTEYDRPAIAPKGWFGRGHRNPTTSTTPRYRVLGSARIF